MSLNKAQKIQLSITAHILDVCKRHGLKIWADWGTLLGTVRHHGFIPWDDDIDLMMMRDDYEKLLKLSGIEFKSPYFFQCAYTDTQYYRGHAKVRLDGTAAILPDDINQPFHQGIFVDIFVYDNIPDKFGASWKISLLNAGFARKCLLTAYYKQFSLRLPWTSIKFLIARAAVGLTGSMNMYRFFERQFTKWNVQECHRVACPTYNFRKMDHRIKEKSWYDETVMMPFEDTELPVPGCYHEVLSREFGADYMTPRHDKTAHGEMIVSTDTSYQEVLAIIKKGNETI